MKEDNHDLSEMLENMKKGLKLYEVKELNNLLVEAINKKSDKFNRAQYILDEVCKEYCVSKNFLLTSTSKSIQEPRRVAICLMFFNLRMPVRKISKDIFVKDWTLFVSKAIKQHRELNEDIKFDREYKQKYDKIEALIKAEEQLSSKVKTKKIK